MPTTVMVRWSALALLPLCLTRPGSAAVQGQDPLPERPPVAAAAPEAASTESAAGIASPFGNPIDSQRANRLDALAGLFEKGVRESLTAVEDGADERLTQLHGFRYELLNVAFAAGEPHALWLDLLAATLYHQADRGRFSGVNELLGFLQADEASSTGASPEFLSARLAELANEMAVLQGRLEEVRAPKTAAYRLLAEREDLPGRLMALDSMLSEVAVLAAAGRCRAATEPAHLATGLFSEIFDAEISKPIVGDRGDESIEPSEGQLQISDDWQSALRYQLAMAAAWQDCHEAAADYRMTLEELYRVLGRGPDLGFSDVRATHGLVAIATAEYRRHGPALVAPLEIVLATLYRPTSNDFLRITRNQLSLLRGQSLIAYGAVNYGYIGVQNAYLFFYKVFGPDDSRTLEGQLVVARVLTDRGLSESAKVLLEDGLARLAPGPGGPLHPTRERLRRHYLGALIDRALENDDLPAARSLLQEHDLDLAYDLAAWHRFPRQAELALPVARYLFIEDRGLEANTLLEFTLSSPRSAIARLQAVEYAASLAERFEVWPGTLYAIGSHAEANLTNSLDSAVRLVVRSLRVFPGDGSQSRLPLLRLVVEAAVRDAPLDVFVPVSLDLIAEQRSQRLVSDWLLEGFLEEFEQGRELDEGDYDCLLRLVDSRITTLTDRIFARSQTLRSVLGVESFVTMAVIYTDRLRIERYRELLELIRRGEIAEAGRELEKLTHAASLQMELGSLLQPASVELLEQLNRDFSWTMSYGDEPAFLNRLRTSLQPDEGLLVLLPEGDCVWRFLIRPEEHFLSRRCSVDDWRASVSTFRDALVAMVRGRSVNPSFEQASEALWTIVFDDLESVDGLAELNVVAPSAFAEIPFHAVGRRVANDGPDGRDPTGPRYAVEDFAIARHSSLSSFILGRLAAGLREAGATDEIVEKGFLLLGDPGGREPSGGQIPLDLLLGEGASTDPCELPDLPQFRSLEGFLKDVLADRLEVADGGALSDHEVLRLGKDARYDGIFFFLHALKAGEIEGPFGRSPALVLSTRRACEWARQEPSSEEPTPASGRGEQEGEADGSDANEGLRALVSGIEAIYPGGLVYDTCDILEHYWEVSALEEMCDVPPERRRVKDDGILTVEEIAAFELNTDLVVLGGCNTAAGRGTEHDLPFSGLPEAFFLHGAKAVMVSHWPAGADATEKLILRLASGLERGEDPARALRAAILDLQADPDTANPALWSVFSILGG